MRGLAALLEPLVEDRRVGPAHVCMYLALVRLSSGYERGGAFTVRREEVMRLGKIQGKTTYYRVMKDLDRWGYVEYRPSFSRKGENVVWIR